jgi:hypothetical protein
MAKILILGNGLSRLLFDKQIRNFRGEIWGCNRVYLDYGDVLTLIYGHSDVVHEAGLYRDAHHLHYKLCGTNEYQLSCNNLYRKDTGSTLAAEALTLGFDIILCGFDLGGPDIYSPNHECKNKSGWVDRWRIIFRNFGKEHIEWWGHNHTPFILSGNRRDEYAKKYTSGTPHLPEKEYAELVEKFKTRDITELVPSAELCNISQRIWSLPEAEGVRLENGDSVKLPLSTCEKYVQLYPREFKIIT